jgi:hypothetical protein
MHDDDVERVCAAVRQVIQPVVHPVVQPVMQPVMQGRAS